MKKQKIKMIVSILAIIIFTIGFAFTNMRVWADKESLTHDYSELEQLDAEYSYGTLFWTNNTKIRELDNNEATTRTEEGTTIYEAWAGEQIELKISECAVDKDGDMCDVICKVDNIEDFENAKENREFSASLKIKKYEDTNLVLIWFLTREAEAHFSMQYVKTGTNTPAKITKAVSTIYDIDRPRSAFKNTSVTNAPWNGDEGFTIDGMKGEVYYEKEEWLIDIDGEKGVRANSNIEPIPFDKIGGIKENKLNKYNSAVVIEELENSTYKLFYSGIECGIAYVFASPYPYELNKPAKTVDEEAVYEGEIFNYTVSQYVPNNYFADELNFIDNLAGKYTSFSIKDEIDDNLKIEDENIKITNESGNDVTEFFEVTINNNNITATAKNDTLVNSDFYAHTYTFNIKVSAKEGAAENVSVISNKATTEITDSKGTKTKDSNNVETKIKKKLDIDATIDNGSVKINDLEANKTTQINKEVDAGTTENTKIYITPKDGYKITSITLDGEEISVDDCRLENGVYVYEIIDETISEDIKHSVVIKTELKDAKIIVKHLDADTQEELVKVEPKTQKMFTEYQTKEEKIDGYRLIETPKNAKGTVDNDEITVIYYYTKEEAAVIANYVDENGKQISESVPCTGKIGEDYKTTAKDIEGYELKATPANEEGKYKKGTTEVNYVYKLKDAKIIVKYVDKSGKEVAESTTMTKKYFEKYETSSKEVSRYKLIKTPTNASGTVNEDEITVIYVYELSAVSSSTLPYTGDALYIVGIAILAFGIISIILSKKNNKYRGI